MKKMNLKIILGLTQKVGASQALLNCRAKNLFVIGAVDGKGLITGQFTKPLMWPIWIDSACRRFLNPTSFLKGVGLRQRNRLTASCPTLNIIGVII